MRTGQDRQHMERNASASQQGNPGGEMLQERSTTKNGECWGLYLAAEGFVAAALFVLPVLSLIMEATEKTLLLEVEMAMVVWLSGE